jgi:RNA polymerase sigma-70 factor, ECF subfamily
VSPVPLVAAPPLEAEFTAIFRAEHGYVFNSLRRLGVREGDIEDLAHEVFMIVHRRMPGLDRTRPLRPWLFATAFRVASDYRRQARHRREVAMGEQPVPSSAAGADELVARAEGQRLILEALDAIEESRRAVFVLAEIDEVPVVDVAEALEIPVNTAYSRLRLAREDFQEAVRRIRARGGVKP